MQVHVLLRANDPVFEIVLTLGGHRKEDKSWQQIRTSPAGHLGVAEPEVTKKVLCVDSQRQWAKWRKVRYIAAIRSFGQSISAPLSDRSRRSTREVA